MEKPPTVRLQKRLAELGAASRREGERLIVAGRVAVNGVVVTELGTSVTREDRVAVDGRELVVRDALTVVINKPRGMLCARKDPEGRPLIYDLLPADMPHLGHVGRLDFNTEGVLLLTNEPGLADGLLRPDRAIARTYDVKLRGRIDDEALQKIADGVPLDGRPTRPVDVVRVEGHGSTADRIRLTLREGKNRHIHRILEALGFAVAKLRRVEFAGVGVRGLELGAWRRVSRAELERLRSLAGVEAPEPPGGSGPRGGRPRVNRSAPPGGRGGGRGGGPGRKRSGGSRE